MGKAKTSFNLVFRAQKHPRNSHEFSKTTLSRNSRALASPRFRLAWVPSRATPCHIRSHMPRRVNTSLTAKRNGGGFSDTACHKPQRKQREPRLHSVWPLAVSKPLCDNEPHAVTKKPCGYGAKRNPVHAKAHHNGKGELRKGKNLRPPYA